MEENGQTAKDDDYILSQPSTSSTSSENLHIMSENSSQNEDSLEPNVNLVEDSSSESLVDNIVYHSKGECYFKTDHPALKENEDYRRLLYTVLVLQAQLSQVIRDKDKLLELREKVQADPLGMAEKVMRGEDIGIPKRLKIPEIPVIDWSKYTLSNVEAAFSKRQLTRHSSKVAGDVIGLLMKPDSSKNSKAKSRSDRAKPSKFNEPWTAEEQKRLEALLIEYPPEDIETRRWEKIANALGNRTTTQVASRVQKYFIKLMKAGIPIPGRQPNSCYLRKPRRQVIRQQPSTFMVSHIPPVFINEEEENFSNNTWSQPTSDRESSSDMDCSDEEIDSRLKNTPEYEELMCIKKVLQKKQQDLGLVQHTGYKCAHCEFEPIIGVRWHCTECPPSQPIDLCEDCVNSNPEIKLHLSSHHMEAIHQATSAVLDRDYMHFASGGDYNYLDPNYMPAT